MLDVASVKEKTRAVPDTHMPTLIVVSGPPTSGKTTLAHALGRAVGCPVISRDELKEGMVHAAGSAFQGGHGDPLTQRTLPLFFEVLGVLVRAGVTVVAEAAFQDGLWSPGLEPLAGSAHLRIVRCGVDPSVSFRRARERGGTAHVRAHGDSAAGKEVTDWIRGIESFEHISLPVPALDVRTDDGYDPGLDVIVDFVNARASA